MNGVTHPKYTQLVRDELTSFLGDKPLKNMTIDDAKRFLKHLKALPESNKITKFNKGIREAADRALRIGMQARLGLRRAQAIAVRKGATNNPMLGAVTGGVITVGFAIYDAVNTPYDENTKCLCGPHIDAGIEGMLPIVVRPEVAERMLDTRRRLDQMPTLLLDVTGPDVDWSRQPYDGGPRYEEGEIGTGVITIGP